jgi:hypothetical protein
MIIIYKTITVSVVLYTSVIWSLVLREEHQLKVFEKLRRMFGPQRNEMIRGWRKFRGTIIFTLHQTV